MQSLFEAVDNRVLQIHCSKRDDRTRMNAIWKRVHGVSIPTFEAIMRPDGKEGCTLSHQGVANVLQAPYIVLEDDALPTMAFHDPQLLFHVIEAIKSNSFDILYLGGLPYLSRVMPTKWRGIVEGRCLSTYGMVVFPRAAEFLQKHRYKKVEIDVELVKANHLRTAFVHPPLFRMAETRSDIGNSSFTKSEQFATLLSRVAPIWSNAGKQMEGGQAASVDMSLLSDEQVKQMRDVLKRELAKTQGSRDVNTVVVKAAESHPTSIPKVSAASKGFSKPAATNVENAN